MHRGRARRGEVQRAPALAGQAPPDRGLRLRVLLGRRSQARMVQVTMRRATVRPVDPAAPAGADPTAAVADDVANRHQKDGNGRLPRQQELVPQPE